MVVNKEIEKFCYNCILNMSKFHLKNFDNIIVKKLTNKEKNLKKQFEKQYQYLNDIQFININKTENSKINPFKRAINEYSIVKMQNHYINENYNYKNKKWILQILESIIKNNINNRRKISIDDCVVLDIIDSTGGYYSLFHTDIEWFEFNNNDCFQVWYLIKND